MHWVGKGCKAGDGIQWWLRVCRWAWHSNKVQHEVVVAQGVAVAMWGIVGGCGIRRYLCTRCPGRA